MKNGKYGIKNQIKNQIKKYARCESEPATFRKYCTKLPFLPYNQVAKKWKMGSMVKNQIKKYARCESEPATFRFAVWCSTDWANHTSAVASQKHVP